ncbi:unnamed protein product [marine sediment metagenome]|uniref:Uncharacterized protein n=1 Tax=marine sediment metagenome TaxID=412755 RepID=X0SZW0_9ZZZZ
MYGQCEICERKDAVEVTLAGGYLARLCLACRNDWGELCNGIDAFRLLHAAEGKKVWAVRHEAAEELIDRLANEIHGYACDLFEAGHDWVAGRKDEVRQAKEPEADK